VLPRNEAMTIRELIANAGTSIASKDAELLLRHELGRDRAWLLAHDKEEVSPQQTQEFLALVRRRAGGEPLQYIVEEQEFFGLALHVTPAVLIPRPETEHLVSAVLDWSAGIQNLHIADVGTGSGAIAIALAKHLPNAKIRAIDVSPEALSIAHENAVRYEVSDRIIFTKANLLNAISGGFDVVVSNPPYVPSVDAMTMQPEVVQHEPHLALFAGEDGLDIYRRLIPQADDKLRSGGLLAMEIGFGQKEELEELLGDWKNVRFVCDYADIPRVVLAEHA
jgi:release factor glutamine methyltransferase